MRGPPGGVRSEGGAASGPPPRELLVSWPPAVDLQPEREAQVREKWGDKENLENCLFNLFTFDIQLLPAGCHCLLHSPFPSQGALCTPRALPETVRRASGPVAQDHLSENCVATQGGPSPCFDSRPLWDTRLFARPCLLGRKRGGGAQSCSDSLRPASPPPFL